MTNKVLLTGKVLNCYIHEVTGALIMKLAVTHEHKAGKKTISVESVFNTVMCDDEAIAKTDVQQGDIVNLTGYLKMDHKESDNGNVHQKLMVYATEVIVEKRKK